MTARLSQGLLAAWLLLMAGSAFAKPRVIYESGQTRPITDYLEQPEPAQSTELPPNHSDLLREVLPIRTPELTPGAVAPVSVKLPYLTRPLFLIGSDDFSKRWLAQYRDRLRKLQAVGMLIQAETEADIEAIRVLAAGLDILPASGSELARQLKLAHYPVLISSTLIEQ